MQDELNEKRPEPPEPRRAALGFVLFMAVLTGVFLALGFWQMARLDWKETLIERVEMRAASNNTALPPLDEWSGFDGEVWDFQPVILTGSFAHDETVLVFTSLQDARGEQSGPGYWVVTPFELVEGGTVFVNRGFVPQNLAEVFRDGGNRPRGEMTIEGIARNSEQVNAFTPGPDFQDRIEWVRNIERLTAFVDADLGPYAPIYVDQTAGEPGALPQGGETKMSFTNRHLEYALTWFSLAALVPVLMLVWFWRLRQKKG